MIEPGFYFFFTIPVTRGYPQFRFVYQADLNDIDVFMKDFLSIKYKVVQRGLQCLIFLFLYIPPKATAKNSLRDRLRYDICLRWIQGAALE